MSQGTIALAFLFAHRSSDVSRAAKKIAEYEGLENGEKLERRTSFEKVK